MKILSLSLDKSILDKNSSLAKRTVEYGNLVEKYTVIVPSKPRTKGVACRRHYTTSHNRLFNHLTLSEAFFVRGKEDQEIYLSERVKVFGVGAANKILTFFKIFGLAKKLIKQEKISLVTVQDQYYFALVGWLLSKKFKVGLEIQIHGFEKYSGLRKLIVKFVIPKANAVRTVSQRLKKRLVDEFGVEENKITVVPVYSDVGCRMSDVGHKSDGKFIFLTVGRLVPVKNIEMQINALANIVKKYSNVELWIVGEGEEKEKLLNLCYALRVTRYAKFLGWQSNVNEFYGKADAFLLTSHSEGWPLVIVEAASFSLPIIMTDMGSAGELIKNNESGLVIPLDDQQKLEECMIKLIEDEELRKKLGRNARQAVLNLPSKQEILNLYKKSWEITLRNYEKSME